MVASHLFRFSHQRNETGIYVGIVSETRASERWSISRFRNHPTGFTVQWHRLFLLVHPASRLPMV